MTAPCGSAPAAAPWPSPRRSWSPTRSPPAPAVRSSWSRSPRTATPRREALDPDRRHRRVRLRAARRAARRRGRPRRALAQGPADRPARAASLLAAVPAARGPARRPGRPRRADPRRAADRRPGRHRVARGGPPSCARSASASRSSTSAATSTPGCGWSPTASSTPSCSPAPGWPGSAGSTRSPRCSTRSRCCPPPARARWRSSAVLRTTRRTPRSPRPARGARRCRDPARRDRRAHPARRPGSRLLGPRRGLRRSQPRASTSLSCTCGPSSVLSTAPRSVRLSATGPLDEAARIGRDLAAELLAEGAADLMWERVL